MLTKKYVEQLVLAWPDDSGHSCNPALFDAWVERERRYNGRVFQYALGIDRILGLSQEQKTLLEKAYADLLVKKDITEISDGEILAEYEIVTGHLMPDWADDCVARNNQPQKVH